MTKYNITAKKEKEAHYRSLVNPTLMDEMKEKINRIIVMEKKYLDKDYSAKKLAEDLGTNTRYISAVVNVRFHMNYTSFINKFRIEEAMAILVDRRYQKLRMEEVSDMVGFSNRQSFYASFYKMMKMTPRQFRLQHLALHPGEMVKPVKAEKVAKSKKSAKRTKAKASKVTPKRKSSKK
jgi:AraC-like DNA-binding protein